MELQRIKQLIDVLMTSDLSELEFSEGDHRLRLVRRSIGNSSVDSHASKMALPAPINLGLPNTAAPASDPPASEPDPIELVKAQLFGILHLAPAPDAPAFVKLGDVVHPGQTLCILEAMKTFHEVKADRAATVGAIFSHTGQEVESGDVLFRLVAKE